MALKYAPKQNHILLNTNINCFKNLTKTVVYLNLKNNMSFWFYIILFDGKRLMGFRKINNRWVRTTILATMIASYY